MVFRMMGSRLLIRRHATLNIVKMGHKTMEHKYPVLFGVPFFELLKVVVCTVYCQVEKHLTEVFLIFSPPQLQCL